MRALLSAWLTSGVLAVVALFVLKALVPAGGSGGTVDEYAQVLRVHLPWLVFCVLMAVAACSYVRDWANDLGRAVAAFPAPVLGGLVAAFIGVPAYGTAVGLILHLIEAVLGVALGMALSRALADKWDAEAADTRQRGAWRRNR